MHTQLVEHGEGAVAIKFSTDDACLFSAGADGRIIKWNIATKAALQSWHTHKTAEKSLAAYIMALGKSDERLFAAINNAVKVWSLQGSVRIQTNVTVA